jgi:hypothetical protein
MRPVISRTAIATAHAAKLETLRPRRIEDAARSRREGRLSSLLLAGVRSGRAITRRFDHVGAVAR